MRIHPTALIDPGARLAEDVEVGPFAIVEDAVVLGPGCRVLAHAQILTGVIMGEHNLVDRGAILGGEPQSTGFASATRSAVRIGSHNIFREHVTVHRSASRGGETLIGDHNFLMGHSHVGHDSVLGDHNIVANAVLLAGHVTVGSRCFLGGSSVYHQFIRVGDLAMIQGNSGFSTDIPPFCIGHSANLLGGLNSVGLRRAGVDTEARLTLKRLYREVFNGAAGPVKTAAALLPDFPEGPAARFLGFLAAAGPKGLSTPGSA